MWVSVWVCVCDIRVCGCLCLYGCVSVTLGVYVVSVSAWVFVSVQLCVSVTLGVCVGVVSLWILCLCGCVCL